MDDLDQRIDALYAGPPGEFTAGRDALAKDLRTAGERDEADRVRQLRRPTKIAAELNRLARGEPEAMAAALEAEGALEAAQRGVLEGTGTADDLRGAEQHEAAAIAALGPDPVIRAALRLAARSPEARDDLRRGRISQDPVADPGAELFGMGPVSLPPRPDRTPRSASEAGLEPAPPSPPAEDELAAARAKRQRASTRQAAEGAARAAARAERAAQEKLTGARRRAAHAGAEARRAATALARVTRELAAAQAQLTAAEDQARAAAAAEAQAEVAAQEAAALREAADRSVAQADEGGPSA